MRKSLSHLMILIIIIYLFPQLTFADETGWVQENTPSIEQSKNIQKIVKENKMLKEKNAALLKELEVQKEKNKGFLKIDMIKWFLSGVGVLLLGWIIGHNISSKKRRSGSLLD
ncbi:MAG: hypothetical protein KOO65_00635 [Desulfobacterales bacterium]|nr:hypothetical protein [Desulfobacterales bacterium]